MADPSEGGRLLIILAQLEEGMDKLFLPLGLLYLGDTLRKAGHEVEIFHEHGTNENIDELINRIKTCKPEWIGFSVSTGPQLSPAIEASKRIKNETDAQVVWGGMHTTMVDGVENEPYVDIAVKGEGEAWVTGKTVTDMDAFQPDWSLIDAERYGSTIHLVTSRGCTHRCGFCYSPIVWERRWKAHSVNKVLEIAREYPIEIEKVEFRDDYFFTDRKRGVKILNELNLPWDSTVRADSALRSLLLECNILPTRFAIGVESASQRLLDMMTKDIKVEDIFTALDTLEEFGVDSYLTFIVNLPTETPEEKELTIEMANKIEREYRATCSVKPYRCYPGTALFKLAVREGFQPPRTTEEWAEYALKVWK